MFLAGLTWWATQRIFPVRYEWGRLSAARGRASGAWLAGRLLPSGAGSIPARAGLLVAPLLLAWLTGLVRPEEKRAAREHLARLRARL